MKIGIITYHRANNVGAVLQNFALQKVLESRYEVQTVDYRCQVIESGNRIFARRNGKDWIKFFLQLNSYVFREWNFYRFRKKYLSVSESGYHSADIGKVNNLYDVLIVGSDQVWNMNLNGGDYTYFLDFVTGKTRKIAYAASMGYRQFPEKYKERCVRSIKSFDYVTVRENTMNQYLDGLGIQNSVVLDPTLLLTGKQWAECLDLALPVRKKYIFVYMVAYTPDLLKEAKEYAKKENLPIYILHYGYKRIPGMHNVRSAGPDDFLKYLYNAEIVFCSSFHAVCFSVLFHKRFICALDPGNNNNNSRLLSLCAMLGLDNCILGTEGNDLPDFSSVDSQLSLLRTKSVRELIGGIEGMKNG